MAVGDAAWEELTSKAGVEMGKFILKYIKPPIIKMRELFGDIPARIWLTATDSILEIRGETGVCYSIVRDARDE